MSKVASHKQWGYTVKISEEAAALAPLPKSAPVYVGLICILLRTLQSFVLSIYM